MIRGIGIDLCDIERMKKAVAREGFVKRLFSEGEIAYAKDKADAASHYAAAFAAKEALAKAGGWGLGRWDSIPARWFALKGDPYSISAPIFSAALRKRV